METKGTLLALGTLEREPLAALAVAAEDSALMLRAATSSNEVSKFLEQDPPRAILVDVDSDAQVALAADARLHVGSASLPILGLTREISSLSFESAFSWGGDDIVPFGRVRPLIGRLRSFAQRASQKSEPRGRALIAETDRKRRTLLGRMLRNAGYDVTFAATAEDAATFSKDPSFALVVANSSMTPDPAPVIEQARSAGGMAPWIITSEPKNLKAFREKLVGQTRVRAIDGFAPVDDILFLSNELARDQMGNQRANPRILWGTLVGYRAAGGREDEHGFTYNVSVGGIYVRTLLPPEQEIVWLELEPPRSDARVRLVGRVAWRRGFGPNGHATTPSGFGLEIVDGAKRDLDAWREGCEKLGEILG